jgi:hypothetical protein
MQNALPTEVFPRSADKDAETFAADDGINEDTWNNIVKRLSGAVIVLASEPAIPPAIIVLFAFRNSSCNDNLFDSSLQGHNNKGNNTVTSFFTRIYNYCKRLFLALKIISMCLSIYVHTNIRT